MDHSKRRCNNAFIKLRDNSPRVVQRDVEALIRGGTVMQVPHLPWLMDTPDLLLLYPLFAPYLPLIYPLFTPDLPLIYPLFSPCFLLIYS